jgi:hypothetical protein
MTTPTLLGYLARFSSFSTQSEVLCTQGLAYLLREHADARSALAGMRARRWQAWWRLARASGSTIRLRG